MKNNNNQKLSKQVFLKYAPFDIKKEGEKRVRQEYPNVKPKNIRNITFEVLNCIEKDDVYYAEYKFCCEIKDPDNTKTSDYKQYSTIIPIAENNLSKNRYPSMVMNYFYTLYGLDDSKKYVEVINNLQVIKNSGMNSQTIYFSLKYYYEFLQHKVTEEQDYKPCKEYGYRGLGHYTKGPEWDKFFTELCVEFFHTKSNQTQESLARQLLNLIQEYGYSYEDIKIALEYLYKVLEKPIPDKPSLGIIPSVMKDAKVKVQEEQDRQLLIDYVYKLFNLDTNSVYPLIQAEVKKYHSKEYGKLTYKGMISTLDYYYNILGNPLPQVPNVGIIPYQYNNALAFYTQRKAVKDNGGLPSTVPVIRVVVNREARIKSQQLYADRYKWKPSKLISEIEVGEDETFDRL